MLGSLLHRQAGWVRKAPWAGARAPLAAQWSCWLDAHLGRTWAWILLSQGAHPMNVWDVSHPCHFCWTSSLAETILSADLDVHTLPAWKCHRSFFPSQVPVSQSQERLELCNRWRGMWLRPCAGNTLQGVCMDEGQLFFYFSAISHLQNRGSCCAALTPVWSRLMSGQEIQQSKSRVGCKGPNTPSFSTCVWKEGRSMEEGRCNARLGRS